ncbi:MAG: hydrogenase expression/formation protein HypE [Deltaproteobacteria bacterium]|jgi:hydrogenase expression/formation protein HypE|nr:hydrogenase expression/formation protein HypE [Deltaproteobacteria bacterium]
MSEPVILLDAGSGGRASQRLIRGLFFKFFSNPILEEMDDAARLDLSGPLAMSTDSYTVDPLEFPGGDIGSLAVHGTVNDVAMLGADPAYLSCAFIIEEGFSVALLEKLARSMAEAAAGAQVLIVTGDTKVVPRGAADKLFINTTGIGRILVSRPPQGKNARPGDAILLSGTLGDHGLTVLSSRSKLNLSPRLRSDSAPLNHMVGALLRGLKEVHVLRDPTRGGLATTLNEIAGQSGVVCVVREDSLPFTPEVLAGCALIGLDPLYLANEGKLICILPPEEAPEALEIMRRFPEGRQAAQIGVVLAPGEQYKAAPGQVILKTALGGERLLGMLEGEQLPRIC